jgi:hypothetical protein
VCEKVGWVGPTFEHARYRVRRSAWHQARPRLPAPTIFSGSLSRSARHSSPARPSAISSALLAKSEARRVRPHMLCHSCGYWLAAGHRFTNLAGLAWSTVIPSTRPITPALLGMGSRGCGNSQQTGIRGTRGMRAPRCRALSSRQIWTCRGGKQRAARFGRNRLPQFTASQKPSCIPFSRPSFFPSRLSPGIVQ